MRQPRIHSVALVAALAGTAAVATATTGMADSVTIETSVDAGTRTFTLTGLTGGTLGSIGLGTAGTAGFVANVTDARYSRVGYQVTANLSDLYKVSGASYDCAKKIASSRFSLGFLASPTALSGVAALADPVWNLSGTLTGTLATTLGVASGTVVTVSDLAGERAEHALEGAFSGVEDSLPVKVAAGAGGAFTSPAPHATCAADASGATSRLMMQGTKSDLSALFAWVEEQIVESADASNDGAVTASELASSGAADDAVLAAAVREGLAAAGVPLTTLDTLVAAGTVTMSQIFATLTATLEPVLALAGQTGTYLAMPKLVADVPSGTAAGTYRGTLTVTQVDVP